jgi:hypothetical protein
MFSGVSTPKKDTKSAQKNKQGYKVWVASYHMIVAAQEWYIQLQHDKETPSWARFKERCHMRFGHPIQTNPLAELAHLRRQNLFQGTEKDSKHFFLMPPLSQNVTTGANFQIRADRSAASQCGALAKAET